MKTTSKFLSHKGQSVLLTETLVDSKKRKFRLSIESDSYAFQCHAYVEAFSPVELKWNRIAFIPYANMKTEAKLAYLPPHAKATEAHFAIDRATLLTMLESLLS